MSERVFEGLEDDGLTVLEMGAWVKEKLHFLRRYVYIFAASMKDKWSERVYIDLFAGPGRCKVRETGEIVLGSALLALDTKYPFTKYVFVEKAPKLIGALEARCDRRSLRERVELLCGDCNPMIDEIVSHVGRSFLGLAFLDPYSLQLKWETVKKLGEAGRVDLIITFPLGMAINRVMAHYVDQEWTALDDWYGNRQWRELYKKKREGEPYIARQLLDMYEEQLKELGYIGVGGEELASEEVIRNRSTRTPLYHLLFASKHEKGHEFWNKAREKAWSGQLRLPGF